MSSSTQRLPDPGDVVEFADKGQFQLGVVTRVDGRSTVRVLSERGRESKLNARALTCSGLGMQLSVNLAPEAVGRALNTLRTRAETRLKSAGDLDELWELLLEAPELLELEHVADLLFASDITPETRLAALWALREDRLHFKCRNGDQFEIRDRDQVDAMLAEAAAEAARTLGRERFVGAVAEVLALPREQRRERMLEAARADDLFQRYLDLVIDHAVDGDDANTAPDATALLDDVEQLLGRQLKGTGARRSFRVLVDSGLWQEDENLLLRKHRIPTSFSDAAEAEATRIAESLDDTVQQLLADGTRRDFTDWTAVTIDDEETLDLDDALSVEVTDEGNYRVAIHIASPGLHAPFGSLLEEAARRRGTSLYLPTGVIPMFPEAVSEDAFSLVEGKVRPALSFIAEIDVTGEILHEEIVRSLVRVDARLTPSEVDFELEMGQGPLSGDLLDLYTVADALHTARQLGGAFSIPLPERKVRIAGDSTDVSIKLLSDDSMARLLVGEFAVLANTIAARYCHRHDLPVTYRTQDPPDPPVSTDDFDDVPAGYARAIAMRRCMRPATGDTRPRPHFALGVSAYVQASSPIRRYNDLMVHYQIEHHLAHGEPLLDVDTMRDACSTAESSAGTGIKVQRDTERYWILRYLDQHKGHPIEATIVSYAAGDRPDRASVMLHDCAFTVNVSTRKRLPLGTVIQVCVEGVNARQGQIHVRMVDGT